MPMDSVHDVGHFDVMQSKRTPNVIILGKITKKRFLFRVFLLVGMIKQFERLHNKRNLLLSMACSDSVNLPRNKAAKLYLFYL